MNIFQIYLKIGNNTQNIYIIICQGHVNTLQYFQEKLRQIGIREAYKRVKEMNIFGWKDDISRTSRERLKFKYYTKVNSQDF